MACHLLAPSQHLYRAKLSSVRPIWTHFIKILVQTANIFTQEIIFEIVIQLNITIPISKNML